MDARQDRALSVGEAPLVEFRNVVKRFGAVTAVDGVSLTIFPGEFFALLGPSGCGKTTLMRLLAGFEAPDSGEVILAGANLAGVPPHRRPTNMMFQSYALFPHMSVWDNVAFGLRQEACPRAELSARVEAALALVRLEGFSRRKPHQLSGGQQQRVALARALVKRPKIVLLDEPLAALDRKLREATQAELKELQRNLGLAFLVVTHDQEEAMNLADRIAVMDLGRVLQSAPPAEIYEAPASRQVAAFVGAVNFFDGEVLAAEGGFCDIATEQAGNVRLAGPGAKGAKVIVALRPEKIALSTQEPAQAGNKAQGAIASAHYFGECTTYAVRLAGVENIEVKVSVQNQRRCQAAPRAIGEMVWLSWEADAAILLPR